MVIDASMDLEDMTRGQLVAFKEAVLEIGQLK